MTKPTNEFIDDGKNKIPFNEEHDATFKEIEPNIDDLNLSNVYNEDNKLNVGEQIETDSNTEGLFTLQQGNENVQSFDDTEKEDFYDKKYNDFEKNYDKQIGNRICLLYTSPSPRD